MAEEENDGPPSERPSFTRFWKRVKQTTSGDNLKFVPSGLQQQQQETQRAAIIPIIISLHTLSIHSRQMLLDADFRILRVAASGGDSKVDGEDGSDSRTTTAKAQARRAQVRRAQIQHRQRKVNYTKQLEMDAARLRDEIARAEGERAALRGENDTIRRRLAMAGVPIPPALQQPQAATTMLGLPADSPGNASSPAALMSGTASTMSMSPSSVQYIVSLDMSEMNSPAYQVYRTSTPSSSDAGCSADTSNDTGAAAASDDALNLTDVQTDYAINFILALEHVCWDHFHPSYFSYAHYDEEAEENTHMLMASAIALQNAPASVFDQMTEVREHLQANPSRAVYPPSSSHPHSPKQTQYGHQHSHHQQQQHKPPPPPIPSPISWRQRPGPAAAGLSLGSLRRLAEVLNPPDVELAPVQAWFEIARMCGPAAVHDAALMDSLKRELVRVVRCVHFGAAIPRHAFDDAIGRVVGVEIAG
ncbi:hypothetical protein DL764_006235 [Monosporascus ibericus]|uniref:BZIP domain-containing protein n=1 Tax=Monosporascus ibericus TaxID=155417 RepID=A0A4Q4T7T9_9PEZI|nr:hypothetical protein DL764_006235 [Monosporascus ibericus]